MPAEQLAVRGQGLPRREEESVQERVGQQDPRFREGHQADQVVPAAGDHQGRQVPDRLPERRQAGTRLIKGAFGDSWFIGGLVVVGGCEELVKQLVVDSEGFDQGFVTFQFFINGEWVQVTVDTFLPYDNESKTIWYGGGGGGGGYMGGDLFVCIYLNVCGFVFVFVCICMYVFVCICMYVFVIVCMYLYLFAWFVFICICMYLYVFICIYLATFAFISPESPPIPPLIP